MPRDYKKRGRKIKMSVNSPSSGKKSRNGKSSTVFPLATKRMRRRI